MPDEEQAAGMYILKAKVTVDTYGIADGDELLARLRQPRDSAA